MNIFIFSAGTLVAYPRLCCHEGDAHPALLSGSFSRPLWNFLRYIGTTMHGLLPECITFIIFMINFYKKNLRRLGLCSFFGSQM